MNNYELMLILKPSLPENVRKGVQERIESIITKSSGKIVNTDIWGKKYLSYPIKKHVEGYYILFQINALSEQIKLVSDTVKLIPDVLRYGIFQVEKFTTGEKEKKDFPEVASVPVPAEERIGIEEDIYLTKI